MDGNKFDHALFVGPPGLGKTAIAKVVACEMASDFHEVLGQSIKSPADLNAVLLAAKEKSIVFIDECHEMKPEYQTALYLALDKRKVIVNGGRTPLSMKVADFTLLLATTDEHRLLATAPGSDATCAPVRLLQRRRTRNSRSTTQSRIGMDG